MLRIKKIELVIKNQKSMIDVRNETCIVKNKTPGTHRLPTRLSKRDGDLRGISLYCKSF